MRKITVSIGIPAFNEEQNIGALLTSIVAQKLTRVVVTEICVISDNSTDKTHAIVRDLAKKYPQIKLIQRTTQKGKYLRMNELFARVTTDVLIIMDADIAMKGEKFIETLATAVIADEKAQMVSARNVFIRSGGFMPQVIYTHFNMWDGILLKMPNVEAAGQFSGTATAFRGSYARTLQIPEVISNPHLFLYLAAKKKNGFRYCTQAEILQYLPTRIGEVKSMLVRAIAKPDEELDKLFGKDYIKKLQTVSRRIKLHVVLKSFIENPFYTPFAILLMFYLQRTVNDAQKTKTQLWTITNSTKKPIASIQI